MKLALKPDEFLISDYFAREHNNLPLLTLHAHIRDNFGYESDAIDTIMPQLARQSLKFVNWLPNPIHLSFSEQITPKTISTVQVNSFHIAPMLIKLSKHFSKIFMRKAFLHRYFADGMDEM